MMKKISRVLVTLIFSSLLLSGNVLAANDPMVRIETSLGNIELQLDANKAPRTVENFLRYTNEGYYNGTIFHRVIRNFMIQGGGFTQKYDRKPTREQVPNEAFNGLRNDRGTIAMARTNMPHSATSQFFINTVNNDFLNFSSKSMRGWGYTVFGKVTKGMDVMDRIQDVQTGPGGPFPTDAPQVPVVIKKVTVINQN